MKPKHSRVIDQTQSLCPVCLQVIEAQIIDQDGRVYMKKKCPDHGVVTSYLWPDVRHYLWMSSFRLPMTQPSVSISPTKDCPQGCGLCTRHLRHSTLIEIEVTHRCNLQCPVCFMAAGASPVDPCLEEIEGILGAIYDQFGPQVGIQITGGEPTIRSDLPQIVQLGRRIGFQAIEINTNGIVISQNPHYLEKLVDMGISGIYLQFDGVTSKPYLQLREENILTNKLQVIELCRRYGIQVVLASTLVWGINHDQIGMLLNFALQNVDIVAGLALQPAFSSGRFEIDQKKGFGMGDVIFHLSEQSGGLIQPQDMLPLGCSHPLCSCGTHLIKNNGKFEPVSRLISPEEYKLCFNPSSPQGSVFADILASKNINTKNSLAVIVMNYMDASTIDLNRLKECSMTVSIKDGRLIPFCAYQLSDLNGHRLYQAWGQEIAGEAAHA